MLRTTLIAAVAMSALAAGCNNGGKSGGGSTNAANAMAASAKKTSSGASASTRSEVDARLQAALEGNHSDPGNATPPKRSPTFVKKNVKVWKVPDGYYVKRGGGRTRFIRHDNS
jgi:hypothetical protein